MIQEIEDKDLGERVELGMEKRGQERKSLTTKTIRTLAGWMWSSTEAPGQAVRPGPMTAPGWGRGLHSSGSWRCRRSPSWRKGWPVFPLRALSRCAGLQKAVSWGHQRPVSTATLRHRLGVPETNSTTPLVGGE